MLTIPLLFAAVIGFNHAFEADHVIAVGNIANKRKNVWQAIRDGLFWGLGHTSMIFVVGCLIIVGKTVIAESQFAFFEVIVGVSLIGLGFYRLVRPQPKVHVHAHEAKNYKLAYIIGLIHGLAGSGAVILLAMAELENTFQGMLYLLLFGAGSIVGMMIVAGIFNLPFSKKVKISDSLRSVLFNISALLCISYGVWMIVRYFIQ